MPVAIDTKGYTWTFGCEHELADWDSLETLPKGFARSPDYTIVNSNGIAAQPDVRVYRYGGEINTPPTSGPEGQVSCLNQIRNQFPMCSVNHRSNLHVHIRVPGLKDSLKHLKQLQAYIHQELPTVIDLIEPIPRGGTPAARKRAKRRRISHHTLLKAERLKHQLEATTLQEFFEREVPRTKAGKPMWHAQPRLAVNLRQLVQTDTIEFRHFPGTLNPFELVTCIRWCSEFLLAAFEGSSLLALYQDKYKPRYNHRYKFPRFPGFKEALEVGYQATACHNGLNRTEIVNNINLILEGKFHGSHAEQIAIAKSEGRKA
jgi:hypothetical protein